MVGVILCRDRPDPSCGCELEVRNTTLNNINSCCLFLKSSATPGSSIDMDDVSSTLTDDVEVINIASQQGTRCRYVRDLIPLIASITIVDNATATGAKQMMRYIKHGQ